jgi:polyisoprenyl-phosphate glycosyltransferase
MKTLTVVCPVYNEEEVIGDFCRELRAVLESSAQDYGWTILFVVDRCQDATLDILREIARSDSRVRILALSSRFGHQMSLLAGIDHSDSDAVIMMDSDLQHPPELLPAMLGEFEKGYDIVYTVREDSHEIHWLKRLTSRAFYRGINAISQVPINESAADFRLISRRVAKLFQERVRERNLFLRGVVGWLGFRNVALPFRVRRRPAGKSKYSLRRMVTFGVTGVISFSKSPLQAAVVVGLGFALFGFGFAAVTLIQYFVYEALPPGWATLTILLSIFSGIQLTFLGVLGQYIGAIFDEVKARPHYIVEERVNFGDPTDG